MAKIRIRRDKDVLWVTRKLEKREQISSVETDILQKGEIPSLLPPESKTSLFGVELHYPLYDGTSLDAYLKYGLSFDQFRGLISRIVSTVQGCESHGIREGNLEMAPEYVFCNLNTGSFQMIYWPLLSPEGTSNIRGAFLDYGMRYQCAEKDRPLLNAYLSYFYSRMRFDIYHFEGFLKSLGTECETGQRGPVSGALSRQLPSLYDLRAKKQVALNCFPFVVGREGGNCHYAIADDTLVSRSHFSIHLQGDHFCLLDSSRNGTLVNGKKAPANLAVELHIGDRVQAGEQEFIFSLG